MRSLTVALGAAAAMLALSGCASAIRSMPVAGTPLVDRPRVVMLPLSNLSGRVGQTDALTGIFFSEVARTGVCDLVEMGETDRLVQSLRLRDTGSLSPADLRTLRDSTGARFALLGSILEAEMMRTPEGEVPSVGVTLRLVETATARVVWADVGFRSGEDAATVFQWGRQLNLNRVAGDLAARMMEGFRQLGATPRNASTGEKK
jgi:TolB-like protein